MKTPQRRFVVEFRSGRRKPKAQTNSIWGDTDLKALAREVEDAASHLFNSNEAAGTPDSGETTRADPINAVNERADDVDVAPAAIPFANGAEVEISKHHEADHPAEAVVQVQESQPASRRRTTSAGTPRKRAKRPPHRRSPSTRRLGTRIERRRPGLSTIRSPSTSLPPWTQTTSASRVCWLNSFVHRTFGSRRCLNDLMSDSEVAPLVGAKKPAEIRP